jgi:hypothetical protein
MRLPIEKFRLINSAAFANCFLAGIGGCWCAHDEANERFGGWISMHWWVLIPISAVVGIFLYGLFRWASGAPEVDVESDREHFHAEQEWRGLRRSGIDAAPHRQH